MNATDASKLLQMIADPNRLTILLLLTKTRKMSANEFLDHITCKQSTLSHHLNEMADADLLTSKKKGNRVFYSLNVKKYASLLNFLGKIDKVSEAEEEKPAEPVVNLVDCSIL